MNIREKIIDIIHLGPKVEPATTNGGISIKLKLGNGNSIIVK
jgi:hypothetical protein